MSGLLLLWPGRLAPAFLFADSPLQARIRTASPPGRPHEAYDGEAARPAARPLGRAGPPRGLTTGHLFAADLPPAGLSSRNQSLAAY